MNEKEPGAVRLSDANLLKSMESLTSVQDGIPAAGKRYIVEHDIILFETDVPAQHMWSPESCASRKPRAERNAFVREKMNAMERGGSFAGNH